MDIQPRESEDALHAGKLAGEYLDSIGVYDLSKLTTDQWRTFCEVMCVNYWMIHCPY